MNRVFSIVEELADLGEKVWKGGGYLLSVGENELLVVEQGVEVDFDELLLGFLGLLLGDGCGELRLMV